AECLARVPGAPQPPAEALLAQHPVGEPADDVEPRGVDVVQRERGHAEALAREPGHELGRVRRAGADDGDPHPLTPVSVTSSTNAFWAAKNSPMTGAMNSSVAIIVRF